MVNTVLARVNSAFPTPWPGKDTRLLFALIEVCNAKENYFEYDSTKHFTRCTCKGRRAGDGRHRHWAAGSVDSDCASEVKLSLLALAVDSPLETCTFQGHHLHVYVKL